ATLAPLVNSHNAMNCSFATDDKLAGDLVNEGHIDHCVRTAIRLGMPPLAAFQIATINTARHYRLRNFGAIAPRYWADFVLFEDLKNFTVRQTYKKGMLVAENGKYLAGPAVAVSPPRSTMNMRYRAPNDFEVALDRPAKIRVIEVVPYQIVTRQCIEAPRTEAGRTVLDLQRDILNLVVVERHRATGNGGVGFVRGFKRKQ